MPPIHPAASLFPMLPEPQLRELADDIKANGQRDPVILWHGQLLDGRNRWMACDRAGVEPRTARRDDITDPVAFVISVNIHRRHLDESQRAMAAARARVLLAEPPEPPPRLEIEAANLPAAAQPRRPPLTYSDVTSMLHVSERSARSAKLVLATGIPELTQRVDAGQTAVSTAAEVAQLPAGKQAEIVARGEKEILAAAKQLRQEKTQARRAERVEALAEIAKGSGPLDVSRRFPVVEADPPWKYADGTTDPTRRVDQKYPPMELEEIKALPVGQLATDAAVLYLWAVNPLLPEALEVGRAWGFEYRTNWVWDKEIAGAGVWGRGQHELLLIFVRGDMPTPPESTRPPSVIRSRRGEHSEKPAEAYERIERMWPTLPKVSLFAREVRLGWVGWGNQAKGAEVLQAPTADGAQQPLPAAPAVAAAGGLASDADEGDGGGDEGDEEQADDGMEGDACLVCQRGPGEPHTDECEDFPAIVPYEGLGYRMACWGRKPDALETADGLTRQGANMVADRWQGRTKGVTRIEIANADGAVIERREKVGKAWSVRTEEPQEAPAPAGGPMVCRTPSRAEQEQMARDFPEFVKPLGPPQPLPVNHPARASKRVGSLIKHAEGAIAARNFDSAQEAIDEAAPLRLPSVDPADVADAVAKLRALLAWAKARPGADDEPPPPKGNGAPKAKRAPREPHVNPIDLEGMEDAATVAKLIKAIETSYSGDKACNDEIRKPVEIDAALWVNLGGSSKGASHRVTLWRVVPIEEWSGLKETYTSEELVARYEAGDTWRGDHAGHQVKQGARFFVMTGQRRVYRWGPEQL